MSRLPWRLLTTAAFLVLLGFAIYLAGSGDEIGPRFEPWANTLVVVAGVSLGVLLAMLGRRSLALYREWRNAEPGAGLRIRLFGLLLLIALPPWILLYGFSLRFLNSTIDSWFSVEVEQALDAARTLAREALDKEQIRAREQAQELAEELSDSIDLDAAVGSALDQSRALALTVFDSRGEVLANVSADTRFIFPQRPTRTELDQMQTGPLLALEGEGNSALSMRVLSSMTDARILLLQFAPTTDWVARADTIQEQLNTYRSQKFVRAYLKTTLTLILSFVLLLGALAALYLAFSISRRLVAPLTQLVAANRKVATGDYSVRVPEAGGTELALLARSFNQMTSELSDLSARARVNTEQSQLERSFLESVLEHIRSGVMVIEGETLKTANAAASALLETPLTELSGRSLASIAQDYPRLLPLVQHLLAQAQTEAREWRAEIILEAPINKQMIMLRGARLPDGSGQVVIADDESDVARAQRESAWGEVARRLAHEIKNPLTPIQLAAERLRRKYLASLPESERDVLDRATDTIVAQVEALKTMVNAFSDYSKAAQLAMQTVAIEPLVREVADLYQSDQNMQISFVFPRSGIAPKVKGDSGRLRQLLHNLLKNAQESSADGRVLKVEISCELQNEGARSWIELSVSDNGSGIPDHLRERLFEPYTTSKTKGTGLGLAIVKKIVEEHGGQIRADVRRETDANQGTTMRVRLPLSGS